VQAYFLAKPPCAHWKEYGIGLDGPARTIRYFTASLLLIYMGLELVFPVEMGRLFFTVEPLPYIGETCARGLWEVFMFEIN
jgi:hypothetical protein